MLILTDEKPPGPRSRRTASRRGDASDRSEPFAPEKVARLFHPWESARKMLLAVSGGPDSISLMLLAAEWTTRRPTALRLHVATVDHGLRAEARAEADKVAFWADRLGLSHDTLVWSGEKPKSKIQELARLARYDLLFAHAGRIGADVVATGHHADDQAETVLFRLLRGSGLAGLSGMAASIERLGLIHARPLLPCSKAELVDFCEARGHPYFDDASNADPAFARTRMRALCGILEEAGFGRDALLRLGRRAARADTALAARAAAVAASLAPVRAPDLFRANIESLAYEPEEIFLRVVGREILALGDESRRLRLDRLETVALSMQSAVRAGAPLAATLGGVSLRLERNHVLTIRTEKPRTRGVAAQQEELSS
jgi:tRNA(Ile)-lysidine synthase